MKTARATGKVYISHSHQDNELVRDLARRLEGAGMKPLVDFGELPAGSDRKKTLREQIRDADAMLNLVTPGALTSPWMMAELGMAEGFDKMILPVTAGVKPRDLPAPLRSYPLTPFDEVDGRINTLSEKLTAAKE